MIDFDLSDNDRAQPVWVRLAAHLEDRLSDARKRNDAQLSVEDTATLRGEIRCLKKILSLGADRPMTGDNNDTRFRVSRTELL